MMDDLTYRELELLHELIVNTLANSVQLLDNGQVENTDKLMKIAEELDAINDKIIARAKLLNPNEVPNNVVPLNPKK